MQSSGAVSWKWLCMHEVFSWTSALRSFAPGHPSAAFHYSHLQEKQQLCLTRTINQNMKLVAAGKLKLPTKGLSRVKLKWTSTRQSCWVSDLCMAAAWSTTIALCVEQGTPSWGIPIFCLDSSASFSWSVVFHASLRGYQSVCNGITCWSSFRS